MKFVLETGSKILIHGYDVGYVSIAGINPDNPELKSGLLMDERNEWDAENQLGIFRTSIIMRTNGKIQSWTPQNYNDLNAEHFLGFHEFDPEIVLLGTGSRLQFPAQECLSVLQQQNLGYEVMDTAAACRTFNVLASEDRDVVMGLLMIEQN